MLPVDCKTTKVSGKLFQGQIVIKEEMKRTNQKIQRRARTQRSGNTRKPEKNHVLDGKKEFCCLYKLHHFFFLADQKYKRNKLFHKNIKNLLFHLLSYFHGFEVILALKGYKFMTYMLI